LLTLLNLRMPLSPTDLQLLGGVPVLPRVRRIQPVTFM
jgi:hypothetical protein